MLSRPSKPLLGREGRDFSGFLRAMEAPYIARPLPAVAFKAGNFRVSRELSAFWLVYRADVPRFPWLLVVRIATLVALAASAALLSDYMGEAPSFCSAASGCGAVRHHPLSHLVLGRGNFIPLPLVGVLGFSALFAASMLSRRATQVAAVIGAATGVYLLSVQAFVIQQFCWLCVTADLSALTAGAVSLLLGPDVWERELTARLRPGAWWALAVLTVGAPLLWSIVKPSPRVSSAVLAYYRPGKLNVVEFADFQCPACRMFAGTLKRSLAPYGDRVHFVRLNKPLRSHQFAWDAARAAVCGEAQHKAEPMADALFAAEDLSLPGIDRVARDVGLDAAVFEKCMLDPATAARVERESNLLVPPDLEGLPTTYIGGKRLLGVQSAETVTAALERASRGDGEVGLSGYVYLPMVGLLALLVVRFGLRRAPT
jgi:uncharacterized membrane protein/predicted DsbA family dithiol-disulfide isomerase